MTTVKDLRDIAKHLGIRGYSSKKRQDLLDSIEAHQKAMEAATETLAQSKATKVAEPPKAAEAFKLEAPSLDANEWWNVSTKPKATKAPEAPEVVKEVKEVTPEVVKAPEAVPSKRGGRSLWHEYISEYCKIHGCGGRDAAKNKEAYAAYKQAKSVKAQ